MFDLSELDQIKLFEEIQPMGKKRVAVIVGRFNPPTKGHYALINTVRKFIKSNPNLKLEFTPVVVVIGGGKTEEDKSKNPLSVQDRITFMQASGHTNGCILLSASNAFTAMAGLRDKGLEPIAIAAGTDRIDDYMRILDKNFKTDNGEAIKHYKIHLERSEDAIEKDKSEKAKKLDNALSNLKSTGEVDTDLVSASLARRAVELGYKEEFAEIVGLTHNKVLANKMYDKIKTSMGV